MSVATRPDLNWRGEGVTVAEVLSALNRVRRAFAQAEAGDEGHPHPRNWVMTLVSVAANAAEEERALHASAAIATHHPSLAITVRDQPHIHPGKIDATVTTQPFLDDYGKPVPCELITLHVHGAAGEHLAALVDPLLVSGVPTYLWWLGTPPFGGAELTDAMRISDALVVDSAGFDRPYDSFLSLADIAFRSHRHLGLGDLQWERLAPWRETTAQFFAPQVRRPLMKAVSEIGLDYSGDGRANRIVAALLVGWFSSALGWKLHRAAAGSGGVVAAIYHAEDGRPVQVVFRSVPKDHLSPGEVSALRIGGVFTGKSFSLTIHRSPQRARPATEGEFQRLHPTGGEDDAGMEIAQRRAQRHREVVVRSLESLHHTATGDPPGESVPPHPRVVARERRRGDNPNVLLTMIDIGDAGTLRHVQIVPDEDEPAMLLKLLSSGARDAVYRRSLAAAAELMRSV